jgi:hypothetical protein
VALVGKAGSGKTTGAEFLEGHLGYHRLSFAAPLKAMCGTTTNRFLLQEVGVGVRGLVEDAWVNLFMREWERVCNEHVGGCSVVVDDCRFPNEYWALKAEGFVFVEVVADRDQRITRLQANGKLGDLSELEHQSELGLGGLTFDYRVFNTGDELDYFDDLRAVLGAEVKRT